MATSQDGDDIQEVDQPNVNTDSFFDSLTPETKERIAVLREKGEPVNILVIGPTGSGKSTLINALMGDTVARVGQGATSVTTEVEEYAGEYEGVKIRVYDTVGFGDTEGKSDEITINEMADANKFDLVLICVRMDSRVYGDVRNMFSMLGKKMSKEIWKRSVIVLTFHNIFLILGSVRKMSPDDKDQAVQDEISKYRTIVSDILSGSVDDEIISDIPYCVAGEKLSPEDMAETWLPALWDVCVRRCSDDAQHLLGAFSMYRFLKDLGAITAAGTFVTGAYPLLGGGIGAVVGAAIPGTTAAAGATVGASIGAAIISSAVALGVGMVVVVGGTIVVAKGVGMLANWLTKKEEPQKELTDKKND